MENKGIERLIPLDEILRDMNNTRTDYESTNKRKAAKKYYYNHYATEEEKQKMDEEFGRDDYAAYNFMMFIYSSIKVLLGLGVVAGLYAIMNHFNWW